MLFVRHFFVNERVRLCNNVTWRNIFYFSDFFSGSRLFSVSRKFLIFCLFVPRKSSKLRLRYFVAQELGVGRKVGYSGQPHLLFSETIIWEPFEEVEDVPIYMWTLSVIGDHPGCLPRNTGQASSATIFGRWFELGYVNLPLHYAPEIFKM